MGKRQRLAVLRLTVNQFPSGKQQRFDSSLPHFAEIKQSVRYGSGSRYCVNIQVRQTAGRYPTDKQQKIITLVPIRRCRLTNGISCVVQIHTTSIAFGSKCSKAYCRKWYKVHSSETKATTKITYFTDINCCFICDSRQQFSWQNTLCDVQRKSQVQVLSI